MIAELGHFSLALSLCLTGLLVWLPFLSPSASYSRLCGSGIFVFLLLSFIALVVSFVIDDFSVIYVAMNSSLALPWFYKLTASWGAHEGSILLWCLILAGWLWVLILRSQGSRQEVIATSLTALVLLCFIAFVFFTSNPFIRHFPPVSQGADLNPLLQDIAFIVHPPMLYMGYVGFTVACALALAGVITNQPAKSAAMMIRPWANHAWAFLGLGIAMGSWWAYYELGWGGWWFWDPVENSSLMPWLTGAALIHSLRAAEVQGRFHRWVVFLALLTFSLSLLGAFLVRSGILSSVHAFAEDKQRGIFLLLIWILLSLGGWWILMRGKSTQQSVPLLSRPGMLLINNILMLFAMICILIGTLYPLMVEMIGRPPVAVGPPYFISLIVPITVLMSVAASLVIFFDWQGRSHHWSGRGLGLFVLPLVMAIAGPFVLGGAWHWGAAITLFIASLLICSLLLSLGSMKSLMAPHRIGFIIGHLGFALLILGAGLNSIYHTQYQRVLAAGEETQLNNYRLVVKRIFSGEQDNYKFLTAHVEVFGASGPKQGDLYPSRRLYQARNQLTSESAIQGGMMADVMVTLGAEESPGRHVFILHYHPFVRWIWLGILFIAIGSLVAVQRIFVRSHVKILNTKLNAK